MGCTSRELIRRTHLRSFFAACVSIELSSLYLASSFWYRSSARRWFIICMDGQQEDNFEQGFLTFDVQVTAW